MDLHIHTKESSYCAKVEAEKVVELYHQKGYGGLVITDHYNREYFGHFPDSSWKDKMDKYLTGYRQAKKAGEKYGMKIFLGIEFREISHINDFLIYGLSEDFLYGHEELYRLPIADASALFRQAGALVIQAHPMRTGVNVLADPGLLDGIEVYNGNHQWPYDRDAALKAASDYSLLGISGSDFHMTEDLAKGGVVFESPVIDYQDFLKHLRNREIIGLIER